MRLSELKKLVADIENHRTPNNPDPRITFSLCRDEDLSEVRAEESRVFIDFDIKLSPHILEDRVVDTLPGTVCTRGDFTFLLSRVPFYSKE